MSAVVATGQAREARVKGCCRPIAAPLEAARTTALASLFKAVADPTRVQMLHLLKAATAPICVCDFVAAFELGQPTVSHHLGRLRDAGLVRSSRHGIWTFHELERELSAEARAVLATIP
jgi:ArsR family transcriptional regulator